MDAVVRLGVGEIGVGWVEIVGEAVSDVVGAGVGEAAVGVGEGVGVEGVAEGVGVGEGETTGLGVSFAGVYCSFIVYVHSVIGNGAPPIAYNVSLTTAIAIPVRAVGIEAPIL
jgi:hypothetical protein